MAPQSRQGKTGRIRTTELAEDQAAGLVRRTVASFGGRFSSELGIDVDAGDDEVERWFLAATLFGTRISATVAGRTFRVLDTAGLQRITQARELTWDDLVELLDRGGYVRYDFRTATRLQTLAEVVDARHGGRIAEIGRRLHRPADLEAALDALPGWGPVTVGLFLRELRGIWPGAQPAIDERAQRAARHLGLTRVGRLSLSRLRALAAGAGVDVRDAESALVRLSLTHGARFDTCPGGATCAALDGQPVRRRRPT